MAIRNISFERWQQAVASAHGKQAFLQLQGDSPGGVAAQLGISRQAVHSAIQRGDLDAIIVKDHRGKLVMYMVTQPSVEAFKARRAARTHSGRRAG